MERPRIGTGEVVLASGRPAGPSTVTVARGESVASRLEEMQAAAGRLSASEPLAISIEGELDREQLASLLDHAEELSRRMELRFSQRPPEAIGSGEIIFARGADLAEPEITVTEAGRIEFDQLALEQAKKPLAVVIEGSGLSARQAGDLVALARDADAQLRIGFSER